MINIQLRSNFKSWIDTGTKNMMEIKDKLREAATFSQHPADWKVFRQCRNKCTTLMRKIKTEYYKNMYKKLEDNHDTGNLYKVTKRQLR